MMKSINLYLTHTIQFPTPNVPHFQSFLFILKRKRPKYLLVQEKRRNFALGNK